MHFYFISKNTGAVKILGVTRSGMSQSQIVAAWFIGKATKSLQISLQPAA